MSWKIRNGDYRVVVMNADGSPGVDVGGRVALAIPHLFAIGIGLLVAGLSVLVAGAVLLTLGLLSGRGPTPVPGSTTQPQPPPPHQPANAEPGARDGRH
jgi:hypothetical protein